MTSLSGGYGYAPSRTPRLPPAPRKPIFYDYSEDFEDVTEPAPVSPIAPIPKRVSNPYHPANLQNNFDTNTESMDEAQHEFVAYLQEATMSELPRDNGCHGNEEGDQPPNLRQNNAIVQATTPELGSCRSSGEAVHVVDFGAPASRLSEERHADEIKPGDLESTPQVAINEPASDSSTLDDPPQPETPAFTTKIPSNEVVRCREDLPVDMGDSENDVSVHGADLLAEVSEEHLYSSTSDQAGDSKPCQTDGIASLPYMSSKRCHDSRFYSLGSGLSDLASFVNQVDRHFQTPGPNNTHRVSAASRDDTLGEAKNTSAITPLELASGRNKNDEQLPGQDKKSPHPPRNSSLRQYTRDHIELKVETGAGEPEQHQVVATRSGPTLVPQPISPAKLLRVKNSIPQLMKALPPLPGYAPAPESPFGPAVVPLEFEPFELSRLTDARSMLSDEVMPKNKGEGAPKGYDPFVFDRKARRPRLKLKHAASFAHEQSRDIRRGHMVHGQHFPHDASEERPTTAMEYSTAPVKRRLPIKTSRPTLTSLAAGDSGTVKRRPGFEKSSTVSELASSKPIDLFSSSTSRHVVADSAKSSLSNQPKPRPRKQPSVPVVQAAHAARIQKVPAEDAGTRDSSWDAFMGSSRLPHTNNEAVAAGELQSFFSDNSLVKPQKGLKKRVSDLKSKITDSHHHHRSPLKNMFRNDNNGDTSNLLTAEAQSTNTFKDLLSSVSQPKTHPQVASSRKMRSTLEKFMKGAKHRLQNWGKGRRKID